MELLLSDPEKKISKEHLKALRAIVFEGLTNPTDVKVWLNMLEKCFMVMDFLEERKVKLMTFLLQKQTEDSPRRAYLRQGQRTLIQSARSVTVSQAGQESTASISKRPPCRTVNQLRATVAGGEGSSGLKQKGVVGRPLSGVVKLSFKTSTSPTFKSSRDSTNGDSLFLHLDRGTERKTGEFQALSSFKIIPFVVLVNASPFSELKVHYKKSELYRSKNRRREMVHPKMIFLPRPKQGINSVELLRR
ncbi:uncharacterized protein E5676_scaffold530G00180 [Cucumis melo var. makuwa]|uniref:Uncharacterized protein n=1 Tax=Cucumis melo var. makuwa TaxID=1194695 RepID=A0A5D3DFU8_CUCMM|nr:uncharacterized protein E5676_scaffold530G00180 [Cucumis melo var. makuwa]